jgi:hypothetical protein
LRVADDRRSVRALRSPGGEREHGITTMKRSFEPRAYASRLPIGSHALPCARALRGNHALSID